jgi:hypothetical protein
MNRWMAELRTNIASRDRDAIISSLVEIVPEYQVSRRWTSSAGKLRVKTAVAS